MYADVFEKELKDLEQCGLLRKLRELSCPQDRVINIDGHEVLNFCSNNYLGLANDPRVLAAAQKALRDYGVGAGASRLICGNMSCHIELEKKIAALKRTEACLVFNSGYTANLGIISALCGRGDIIFSDRLNHASIVDGILLSRAEFKRYPHCDLDALEVLLGSAKQYKRRLIVTDTVFSMDGDIAPLDQLVKLARKYDCMVMTDEAHGFGVLGNTGAGVAEMMGVSKDIDAQMGTLSKAAGCMGAYVCGSREIIDLMINKARSFIYTTAMPPSIAAAAAAAVDIIRDDIPRRERLLTNAACLWDGLRKAGFETSHSLTAIVPLLLRSSDVAVEFSRRLFTQGIFVAAVRPPTVPEGTARLRLTAMATHTIEDINKAVSVITSTGKEMGMI